MCTDSKELERLLSEMANEADIGALFEHQDKELEQLLKELSEQDKLFFKEMEPEQWDANESFEAGKK